MSTVTQAPPKQPPGRYRNLAEVLEAVGHVPAHRIRAWPPPGEATEDDLLQINTHEDVICELVNGILVEKVMATHEASVAAALIGFIAIFQRETKQKLGIPLGADGLLRLFPGRVRAPDVSFLLKKSLPKGKLPKEAIASLAPDLAVEVLSESNSEEEMQLKMREYFQAGSKLVWLVDPKTRTVRVYTSPRKSVLLTEDESVDGGKVLPGFSLSIREWFEEAGEVEE
jgi:Uma2 family endonuclease